MDIIDILASDNYIMCNKMIAKKYGIEEAILLGAMCSYQKGFKNEEFYREQEKILDDTALTLYSLRKAMKTLQSLGILSLAKKGLPAKHYYKINSDVLAKCLSSRPIENDSTGGIENNSTNNNYYKNNCYKENILKESSDVQETNSSSNTNLTSSTMFDLNSESQSSKPNALTSEKVCITDTGSIEETKPSHTNKVSVDSGKEIISFMLKDNTEFKVTEGIYNEYEQLYPNVNVMQELRNLKAWCISNPSKRKTRKGALRFVNGWLSRKQGQYSNNTSSNNYKAKVETKPAQKTDWHFEKNGVIGFGK